MGLFSRNTSDSKARIEELKKKIQAEQAAFNAEQAPAAPQPAAPTPQPAAPVAPAPVQAAPQPVPPPAPAPQPAYQQQYVPPQPAYQAPVYQQPRYEEPREVTRRPFHLEEDLEDSMEEIKTGIILDLGEGMSLNLPIRSRMRLDEFLHIADRVRELQRLQRQQQY